MTRLAASLAALALSARPAWAQAENIGKAVDVGVHATSNIVDQGGIIGSIAVAVGVLSLLLHIAQGWAIVSLYKANQTLQEKRAQDATESTKQVATTAVAGSNAIMASNERSSNLEQRVQSLAERIGQLAAGVGVLSGEHANIMRGLDGNAGRLDSLISRPTPSPCRSP